MARAEGIAMYVIESIDPVPEPALIKRMSAELGVTSFNMTMMKLIGYALVGCVVVAAPFIAHAAVTKKPGTVWED